MVQAIWNTIKEQPIQPVYVLTGTEAFLIDETIRRILTKAGITTEQVTRFDLTETPLQQVMDEADELPFFEEYKVIIGSNARFLTGQEIKRTELKQETELFEKWLDAPSPTCTIILIAPYESLDGRKRITKKLKKQAVLVEANALENRDIITWLQQTSLQAGVKIDQQVAIELIDRVGTELLQLNKEVEKLAAYNNYSGQVTEEQLWALVPRTPEMDVFSLTNYYVAGNKVQAVKVFHDLIHSGKEPIMLIALIAGQVRLMIQVEVLKAKGYSHQQIAKHLQVHPYRVKLVMNRPSVSIEELKQRLYRLSVIDEKLKTTSTNAVQLIDLFILNE